MLFNSLVRKLDELLSFNVNFRIINLQNNTRYEQSLVVDFIVEIE